MEKIFKFFSKNKKILLITGLVLVLTLILLQPVRAQVCDPAAGWCGPCLTEAECVSPCVWDPYTGVCWGVIGWVGGGESLVPGCICAPTDLFCPLKCIAQYLFSLPVKMVFFLPGAIGIIIAVVSAICAIFTAPLANNLINISLTYSTDYTYIEGIWTTMRNFANSFFALFLAIIGLATILRLGEYGMKKALVPLIIVALLINFAPTFVRVITNIGNSFTNYFLGLSNREIQRMTLEDIWQTFIEYLGRWWDVFKANGNFFDAFLNAYPPGAPPAQQKGPFIIELAGLALLGIVMALFFIAVALINLLFGLIFLIRMIFLWILVIVSPIAFITAIFGTKEIKSIFPGFLNWDGWWTAVLQWAFMGIPLAFWLYIANLFLSPGGPGSIFSGMGSIASSEMYISGLTDFANEMFPKLIVYTAALFALYTGVTTSPGLMGEMAGKVFGMAQGFITGVAGGAAGYVIGKEVGAVKQAGARVGAAARRIVPKPAREWAERQERAEYKGLGKVLAPITYARRRIGKGITAITTDAERREFEQGLGEGKKEKIATHNLAAATSPATSKAYNAGRFYSMLESEQYKEVGLEEDDAIKKSKGYIKDYYTQMARMKRKKEMKVTEETFATTLGKDFGDIAEKEGIYTADEKKKDKDKGIYSYTQKIFAEAKTADEVKRLQKGWWNNAEAMNVAQIFWTGTQIGHAAREFGREFSDVFMARVEKDTEGIKKHPDPQQREIKYKKYIHMNPSKARYLESSGAQELGLSSIYALAPDEIKGNKAKKIPAKYKNIREILAEKP